MSKQCIYDRQGRLIELHLCNLELERIPSEVWNMPHLQTLNLSHNQLTLLPPQLGSLTRLRTLDVSHNQLTTLPYQLADLTDLRTLDANHNRLTSLPSQLGHLTDLRLLDVSYNQLTSLPYQLGSLTDLRTLDVSHNQLAALPYQLGDLIELRTLDVSHNRLSSLPSQLGNLTELRTLDVDDNRLSSLPPALMQLVSHPKRVISFKAGQQHMAHKDAQKQQHAEIAQAEELLQIGQERAAGTIAGVVLESYLKKLCNHYEIAYSEKAGLQILIQNLQEEEVITSEEAHYMTRLASIRNKCAHSGPIAKQEVMVLVNEVKKLIA